MLQLLGDQLIRSPRLAVFELVKNAYDADSTEVEVSLEGLGTENPTITVTDNGEGMSLEIIRDIWLVPGHEHRKDQKNENRRTRLGRLPMGDKGVGRFAVHRLGNIVELTSRSKGEKEVFVRLDWPAILQNKFLEDAMVAIDEREPEVFLGDQTGTKIFISDLRDTKWSRGDLRRLYRDITSICSPFDAPDEFDIKFKVPSRDHEFDDIPDAEAMKDRAIWKFNFGFDGKEFNWNYLFQPPPHLSKKVAGREKSSSQNERLLLPKKLLDEEAKTKDTVVADEDLLLKYVFDHTHGDPADRLKVPPILIFARSGTWRDMVFLGLAVPGAPNLDAINDLVAVWKLRDGSRFQNYRASLTILDVPVVPPSWIDEIASGNPLGPSCPESWRDWATSGVYRALKAPRAIEHRSREEQLPSDARGIAFVERIHAHFGEDPYRFEACAARIAEMMLPAIAGNIDLTRAVRDGGRDATGKYRIGEGPSAVLVEFALEAKCYAPGKSVGVKELSRLISRLRHRQFGILVTTSFVGSQAY